MRPPTSMPTLVALATVLGLTGAPAHAAGGVLSGLGAAPSTFEPGRAESVEIEFVSAREGQAIVRLFGPDWTQVRELEVEDIEPGAPVRVRWDGRDDGGDPVPPEAYFPVVEFVDAEGRVSTLDPSVDARVGSVLLEDLHFHRDAGAVSYRLAEPARVTIHAGVSDGGPLLRTLVSDAPRLAGTHHEPWDGRDAAGAIDVAAEKAFRLFADGVALWSPVILVRGAGEPYATYRRRVESRMRKRAPRLEDFGGTPSKLPRPHDVTPEPRFTVRVSGARPGEVPPVVSGQVRLEVALDESVRIPVLERRFEIVLFVDLAFVTEVEEGQSPATLIWDSNQVPDGEHLLTVNVATLPGQMSTASTRVRVDNRP